MIAKRPLRIAVTAAGVLALGLASASPQLDYDFMPQGGKALLLQVLGSPPEEQQLRDILSTSRSETAWLDAMAPRTAELSERERLTLAAYLAINMPLPDPDQAVAQGADADALNEALPRDGRELGWYECQYCHSLFTSHLTQDRGVQAWLNMFESPFHREMKMTQQEREEFSHYSAINMPMRIEDVPPDLRF
jgi:hypothetical protein